MPGVEGPPTVEHFDGRGQRIEPTVPRPGQQPQGQARVIMGGEIPDPNWVDPELVMCSKCGGKYGMMKVDPYTRLYSHDPLCTISVQHGSGPSQGNAPYLPDNVDVP